MSNQPPPTQSPSKQADVADAATASGNDHERIYTSSPDELQLTVRAIITGCVIGGIVGAMNITIGLKIGWSFGGSIISAVLGFAFWATVTPIFNARKFGVLETNIAQTTGSAAGAMASAGGLLAPIPALAMLEGDHGYALNYLELTLWCLGVGYLGLRCRYAGKWWWWKNCVFLQAQPRLRQSCRSSPKVPRRSAGPACC